MDQVGQSRNLGGRPKGSYGGRIQALMALDKMMAKRKNKNALIRALEKEFNDNPGRFFRSVIMPLLPKETKLALDAEGVVEWRSLLEVKVSGGDGERGKGQEGRGEERCGMRDAGLGGDGIRDAGNEMRDAGGAIESGEESREDAEGAEKYPSP